MINDCPFIIVINFVSGKLEFLIYTLSLEVLHSKCKIEDFEAA